MAQSAPECPFNGVQAEEWGRDFANKQRIIYNKVLRKKVPQDGDGMGPI